MARNKLHGQLLSHQGVRTISQAAARTSQASNTRTTYKTIPHLGVGNDSDDLAVLLDLVQVLFDLLLAHLLLPLGGGLGECSLLALIPDDRSGASLISTRLSGDSIPSVQLCGVSAARGTDFSHHGRTTHERRALCVNC